MFLTIIALGPKSLKDKLDVRLQPLLVELKHLWEVGVKIMMHQRIIIFKCVLHLCGP